MFLLKMSLESSGRYLWNEGSLLGVDQKDNRIPVKECELTLCLMVRCGGVSVINKHQD